MIPMMEPMAIPPRSRIGILYCSQKDFFCIVMSPFLFSLSSMDLFETAGPYRLLTAASSWRMACSSTLRGQAALRRM